MVDDPRGTPVPRSDGDVRWIEETIVDPPPPPRRLGPGSMLAAAMLAVGEIIEPAKTGVEIEAEADGHSDGLSLDFGDLPDLA